MYYPFGPYAPDKPLRLNDNTLSIADNVYPLPDGYRPMGQFEIIVDALPNDVKGAASFTSPGGVSSIIVGTETDLYKVFSGAFESIATGFSLQGNGRWRFAQFGGLAIATNGADPLKKIDLQTMEVANLGGSPPLFESLGVVKDFLVGTCRNGDISTVGWSGLNNAEWWTPGQRQSDYQIMPSGGRVNGILSGEYGVILQRDRICTMDYVGGNVIFEINEASSNIGCVTPHSVAQWGRLGFFYSDDGFMMWNGSQPVPIGQEIVNRTFAEMYNARDWPRMSTAIDSLNDCVVWSLGEQSFIYNWVLQKWSTCSYPMPVIFSGVTRDLGIDEDYDPAMPEDANVDGAGLVPFDDPLFQGGDPRFYVFNEDLELGTLTGAPMEAELAGNDLEMMTGRRANLRFVRPDIDAVTGVSVTLATKQRLGDTAAETSVSTMMASGDVPVRANGRYTRPTWNVAAGVDWSYFKGAEYIGSAGAGR